MVREPSCLYCVLVDDRIERVTFLSENEKKNTFGLGPSKIEGYPPS